MAGTLSEGRETRGLVVRERQNPFRLRASEHIQTDDTFVRLFCSEVLDALGENRVWERPLLIRSTPGAGKTSLLRLFTPQALLTVHSYGSKKDEVKDLFNRLKGIGAIDDRGPRVLGALVSCAHGYSIIQDLGIDVGRQKRLLCSLLNARIALRVLQGIMALKGLERPHDLERVSLSSTEAANLPAGPTLPCHGADLYDWASRLEQQVCKELDSLALLAHSELPGHESLFMLNLLGATSLALDSEPVANQVLLMFDDLHRLTPDQREFLFTEISVTRPSAGVWLAERLEALPVRELIFPGGRVGRDFAPPVHLEEYWRTNGKKKFFRIVLEVADRRARDSTVTEVSSFRGCIQETLTGTKWEKRFQRIAQKLAGEMERNNVGARYSEWLTDQQTRDADLSPEDRRLDGGC